MRGLILASSPPPADYPQAGPPACLYHARFQVELDRQIASLRKRGAAAIRVVTGYHRDLVREHCAGQDVELVYQPLWAADATLGFSAGVAGWDDDLCVLSRVGEAALGCAQLPQLATVRARALERQSASTGPRAAASSDVFAMAGLYGLTDVVPNTPLPYSATDEARLAPLMPTAWRTPPSHRPCTTTTSRCLWWSWSETQLRPACCTRHLRELLIFTDRLLTRHKILHWLDWGPLLGAVRDGRLIPWDFDVDFGVMLDDFDRIAALRGEIGAAGHVLNLKDDYIWRIHFSPSNILHADLFPWHLEDGRLAMDGPYADDGRFDPKWLDNLQPVRLFGHEFLAPAPHTEFLTERYGADFRTPVRYNSPPAGPAGAAQKFVKLKVLRGVFRRNLQQLRDTLATTPADGHYWLSFGQLLAAVRDGGVLPQEEPIAEFVLLRRHHPVLLEAAPALVAAGFAPYRRYRNHGGEVARYVFLKDGAKFIFCIGDATPEGLITARFGNRREWDLHLPAQGWTQRRWLDRDWLAPEDAEAELRALYGDWRRQPLEEVDQGLEPRAAASRPWVAQRPEHWQLEPAEAGAATA